MNFGIKKEENAYGILWICTNLERASSELSSYPEEKKRECIKIIEECRIILCSVALEPSNIKEMSENKMSNIRVLLQVILLDIESFGSKHPVVSLFKLSKMKYLTSVYNKNKLEVDAKVNLALNKIDNLKEGEKFSISESEWIVGSNKDKRRLNNFSNNDLRLYSRRDLYNKLKTQYIVESQPIPERLLLVAEDI